MPRILGRGMTAAQNRIQVKIDFIVDFSGEYEI